MRAKVAAAISKKSFIGGPLVRACTFRRGRRRGRMQAARMGRPCSQAANVAICKLGANTFVNRVRTMDDLNQLLDKIKETRSLSSDAALGRLLKVSRATISGWRKADRLPDPVATARIADLSGEPLARVLGMIGEARAKTRDEKAVWRRLASGACLVLALGQAGWAKATSPSEGATSHNVSSRIRAALRQLRIGGALRATA